MRTRARGALALLTLLLCLTVTGTSGAARAQTTLLNVEDGLMCVLCHEPLALANSPQASAERALAQGLIDKGQSKTQILHAMIAQYGVAVLAKPPASGFDLTVYILPPGIVLAGIVLLAFTLPRWRRRSREAASTPMSSEAALTTADARRLDEDLAAWD